MRPEAEAGVYVFGALAITSTVTSCAGALVALLSLAGQLKEPSKPTTIALVIAAGVLIVALLSGLASALLAYLNQLYVVFGTEKIGIRTSAIVCGVAAAAFLAVGGATSVYAVFLALSTAHPPSPTLANFTLEIRR